MQYVLIVPAILITAVFGETHLTERFENPDRSRSNGVTAGTVTSSADPDVSTSIGFRQSGRPDSSMTGQQAFFHMLCSNPLKPMNALFFYGMIPPTPLTISNVQYTADPAGTSPYLDQVVELEGIAFYADPYGYAIAHPDGGPWSGLYIADYDHRPELGDEVRLKGKICEYYGLTEMKYIEEYTVISQSNAPPSFTYLSAADAGQEAYEGVPVSISNLTISSEYVDGYTWEVEDDGGTCLINHHRDQAPYRYIPVNDNHLAGIRGLVWETNGVYKLQVRNDDDFVGRKVEHYALRGLVMTPKGPRTNWYVEIRDDDIVGVTATAPSDITVTDTGGIIFPGLIDAHNHPSYNSFPTLMFNNFPFGHRDEWGDEEAEYDNWKAERRKVRNHAQVKAEEKNTITKWGEILQLMAGCVAIQGQSDSDPEHAHPGVILYNVEEFPSRIATDIFPWTMSSTERKHLHSNIDGGAVNAVLIHLCEGPDETARRQFDTWAEWELLDESTTIIHGTALGSNEMAQVAAANAKIVWAPMSNMKLYGATLDIRLCKEYGVTLGLSPDWTLSGCYNMLEELGYAWYLNNSMFGSAYTSKEMCDMVTINNAKACGFEDRYGKIAVGYNAGLMVIDGEPADPYMALIEARPKDVILTIVDGIPRYGNTALMDILGFDTTDKVDVHGVAKTFNIAVDHPFLEYSDETFAQIRANLQAGHGSITPSGELDANELRFLDLNLLQGSQDDVAPFAADNPIASFPAPGSYDDGDPLSITFNYQDFWDNHTFITSLIHDVEIVPQAYPNRPVQLAASEVPNNEASETVSFNLNFQDMHTNYLFRFLTRDRHGNVNIKLLKSHVLKKGKGSDRNAGKIGRE
jgi:hypothetical protein